MDLHLLVLHSLHSSLHSVQQPPPPPLNTVFGRFPKRGEEHLVARALLHVVSITSLPQYLSRTPLQPAVSEASCAIKL